MTSSAFQCLLNGEGEKSHNSNPKAGQLDCLYLLYSIKDAVSTLSIYFVSREVPFYLCLVLGQILAPKWYAAKSNVMSPALLKLQTK